MDAWSILRPFVIFCGHLVQFVGIWCISPRFGILHQEKSGNPETMHAKSGRNSLAKPTSVHSKDHPSFNYRPRCLINASKHFFSALQSQPIFNP
jgi:hypothetical protein